MANLWAALGGFLYRLRGGLFSGRINRTLTRLLFFAPLALIVAGHMFHSFGVSWPVACIVAPMLALLWIAICLGHGSYMDLNHTPQLADDEFLKPVLDLFYGDAASYGRDYAGLCINGLMITLMPGLAAMLDGFYFTGFLLIASGAAKGFCYHTGYQITDQNKLPQALRGATEIGEVLFGIAVFNGAVISAYVLMERLIHATFN